MAMRYNTLAIDGFKYSRWPVLPDWGKVKKVKKRFSGFKMFAYFVTII